ncbi:MAG: hypothetical protein RMY28_009595 [Nostoc sp. ChiSLP01]|nr:hypothetical protein [Nostoc sp. CmiSLP01]MDZ8285191.1 hypothetical protein [Nostoc sp. ChiSLP01]
MDEFEIRNQMLVTQQQLELASLDYEILNTRKGILAASSGIEISCLEKQLSILEQSKQSLEFKHQVEINALETQRQYAMLSKSTLGGGQTIEMLKGEIKEIIKTKSISGEEVPAYVGLKVEGADELQYVKVDLKSF